MYLFKDAAADNVASMICISEFPAKDIFTDDDNDIEIVAVIA